MSFLQPSVIQIIGDSVGIPNISESAAKVLAPDAEYRVRELIQDARKFMRHAKRSTLTSQDIEDSFRLRNVEPVYGLGRLNKDPARFVRAAGHADLFYIADQDIRVDQIIDTALPKAPVDVGLVPHWLAVDGVQPTIPENASLERPKAKRQRLANQPATTAEASPSVGPASKGASAADVAEEANGASAVRAPVKHVLSQELQLYLEKVSQLLRAGGRVQSSTGGAWNGGAAGGAGSLGLHPDPDADYQRAVLASLATDPGLHPLAPYLVQLVAAEVAAHLRSLPHLSLLLAALAALLTNPSVQMEPFLHQILPVVITCLVAKRLGAGGAEDHWAVRDQAARLVAHLCTRFSDAYYNMQPRISRTLLKALLDKSKPLTTHYGAIVGLAALGPQAVRMQLLPNLKPYVTLLEAQMGSAPGVPPQRDEFRRQEASRCYGALLAASAGAMYNRITQRYLEYIVANPRKDSHAARLDKQSAEPATSIADTVGGTAARPTEPPGLEPPQEVQPSLGAPVSALKEEDTEMADAEDLSDPNSKALDQSLVNSVSVQDPLVGEAHGKPEGVSLDQPGSKARDGEDEKKPAESSEPPAESSPPIAGSDAGVVGSDARQGSSVDREQGMGGVADEGSVGDAEGVLKPDVSVVHGNQPLPAVRAVRKPCVSSDINSILQDAWKEDSDVGLQLEALQELFGDALLPWVPFMPGAAAFI